MIATTPDLDRGFSNLFRVEGLDDVERMLRPRTWDEVPLTSRRARLSFIGHLGVIDQCAVLLEYAVKHLDRLIEYVDAHGRSDLIVISISGWPELEEANEEPLIPGFWITSDPTRETVVGPLWKSGICREAHLVSGWLRDAGLLETHRVLDPIVPAVDRDLQRVYVARNDDPRAKSRIIEA